MSSLPPPNQIPKPPNHFWQAMVSAGWNGALNLQSRNKDGKLPLLFILGPSVNQYLRDRRFDFYLEFVQMGGDINATTEDGVSALFYACGYPEIFKDLLEKGANPNQQSRFGNNPFLCLFDEIDNPSNVWEDVQKINEIFLVLDKAGMNWRLSYHGCPPLLEYAQKQFETSQQNNEEWSSCQHLFLSLLQERVSLIDKKELDEKIDPAFETITDPYSIHRIPLKRL